MSVYQLTLSLCLLCAWSYSEKTEGKIHSLLTNAEFRALFGNYDKIPSFQTATVLWNKLRKRRYSEFQSEHYHAEAFVMTNQTTLHLRLRQHSDIIAPNFKMTIRHSNYTEEIEPYQISYPECLYHGTIASGGKGLAAVSTCNNIGLTGIIITEQKYYVLQPLPRHLQDEEQTHVIYEKSNMGDTCATTDKSMVVPEAEEWNSEENSIQNEKPNLKHTRTSRATNSQRTIETAVFVDDVMYNNIKDEFVTDANLVIRDIVFTFLNSVQLLYNQPTLHTPFKIVLIKLEIITSSENGPSKSKGDITKYLTNFCNWQSRKNPKTDKTNPDHWDHALMLSGLNLHQDTPQNNKVIGLAWVSGMCHRSYSCSINEGNTFETVFVITHEMGHNLGMHHDGANNTCHSEGHIMSPSLGPGKITWSECSEEYMNKFLKSSIAKCLDDSATPSSDMDHEADGELPGQKYNSLEQCKKAFGTAYKVYSATRKPFENICRELWCASGSYAKRAHPALDGTKCATGKICKFGVCVTDDRTFSPTYDQRFDKA